MIELISIVVLTFAVVLAGLGLITLWLEHGRMRLQGVALAILGLTIGGGYSFLGSRFALAWFGRLVVRVDLPSLMITALTYTLGVLGGGGFAAGLFLWATGRFRDRVGRSAAALTAGALLVAFVVTYLAITLSH
jgi:hypothetical protein